MGVEQFLTMCMVRLGDFGPPCVSNLCSSMIRLSCTLFSHPCGTWEGLTTHTGLKYCCTNIRTGLLQERKHNAIQAFYEENPKVDLGLPMA